MGERPWVTALRPVEVPARHRPHLPLPLMVRGSADERAPALPPVPFASSTYGPMVEARQYFASQTPTQSQCQIEQVTSRTWPTVGDDDVLDSQASFGGLTAVLDDGGWNLPGVSAGSLALG